MYSVKLSRLSVGATNSLTLQVVPGQSLGWISADRALGSSDDFIFKATYFNNADCILSLINFSLAEATKVCFEFL